MHTDGLARFASGNSIFKPRELNLFKLYFISCDSQI